MASSSEPNLNAAQDVNQVEVVEVEDASSEQSEDHNVETDKLDGQMVERRIVVQQGVGFSAGTENRLTNHHHSKLLPYVGMEFKTHEEAYRYYKLYARSKGFKVRKHSTRKSKKLGEVVSRNYVCTKQGVKRISETVRFHKGDMRTDCKANIWVTLNHLTGLWKVSVFLDEHNHELRSPLSLEDYDSDREMAGSIRAEGLRPTAIPVVINVITGNNVQAINHEGCSYETRKRTHNNMSKECVPIIRHFQNKRNTDPLFYFSLEIDEEQTLRSVVWADGGAISSYLDFGDVVVFDVTYRRCRYSLPFAPFTGLNHHRQPTFFGGALLADETEDTFEWLFDQWLQCMCNKPPSVIITDLDPAICKAISKVFPSTKHRYCSWHVRNHLLERLPPLRIRGSAFQKDFDEWYNADSIMASDMLWQQMKEKYRLQDDAWLMDFFEKREHWVPVYWKNTFTAGVTSSQRNETGTAYFDGYVNATTPPDEFIKQYDKALKDRRKAEKKEDFKSINWIPNFETELPIESNAAKLYTQAIFKVFQEEFKASLSYWKQKLTNEGPVTVYIVGKSSTDKSKWRKVMYDKTDGDKMSCSCAKFESEGVLCRHVLCLMKFKMVPTLPERYILQRWSVHAPSKALPEVGSLSNGANSHESSTQVTQLMKYALIAKVNRILENAYNSTHLYNELSNFIDATLMSEKSNEVQGSLTGTRNSANMMLNKTKPMNITAYDPLERVGHGDRPRKMARTINLEEVPIANGGGTT